MKSEAIKRTLSIVNFLTLVHLLAIVGLVSFLFGTGKLNRERVTSIVGIVRGDVGVAKVAASQPTSRPAGSEASAQQIARDRVQEEVANRRSDRMVKELQDQDGLLRTLMMDLVAKEESLAARETALAESRQKLLNEEKDQGFKKTLQYVSSIKPDNAKELLRPMKEPDAVRFFLEMDLEVGKKIIDKCTSPEDRQWIGRILEQIRDHDVLRAEVLAARANPKR